MRLNAFNEVKRMVAKVEKQTTGFKFGKYRLTVIKEFGQVSHNGRIYRLVGVQTHDGQDYLSLRLYNGTGKFIKQLLIEPCLARQIGSLFNKIPPLDVILGKFTK